jgi:hypothetical protein
MSHTLPDPVPVADVVHAVVHDLLAHELRTCAAEVRAVSAFVAGHPAATRLEMVAERLERRAEQ